MSRLDPGYSSWRGTVLKHHNYAQLQLLKLQLQVRNFTEFIDSKISYHIFRIKQLTETSFLLSLKRSGDP